MKDPNNDQVRLHEVLRQREISGGGLNERLLEPDNRGSPGRVYWEFYWGRTENENPALTQDLPNWKLLTSAAETER